MKMSDIVRQRLNALVAERNAHMATIESLGTAVETRAAAASEDQRAEASKLTPEETAQVEELRTKIQGLDPQIDTTEAELAEWVAVEGRATKVVEAGFQFKKEGDDGSDMDIVRSRPAELRDASLRNLEKSHKNVDLGDHSLRKVESLIRQGKSVSYDPRVVQSLLLATENDDYRSAWMKLVTDPHPILTPEEQRAVQRYNEVRAMSIGTTTAGGFGIPVLIDPSIVLTAQGSLNPFRRIARNISITTNIWKGVSSAGVTWSYDAEAAAVSDDSPTLAQPTVETYAARGFIPFSYELAMDYPGFASEMSVLLNEGYDELQAAAFATGTGSGQPFGILTALDANTNVEVVVTTDGSFGGVDINKVWGALPDRYKTRATWVMNHDVGNEIATFGNSNNLSFVTVDLTGIVQTIRTRPIEFASAFPDFTGTTGAANILVVGDFQNYAVVDRVGMSVELIPNLFDITNNRPTGQRGWFAFARHGADSINDLGFRLLQNQ